MGQMLPYVMWGLILKLWLFPEGACVPISIDMNFLFHEKKWKPCTVFHENCRNSQREILQTVEKIYSYTTIILPITLNQAKQWNLFR